MFFQTLNAILQLDLAFFEWAFWANIHWIFIFAAVMVLFQAKEKHRLFYITMLITMLWAFVNVLHTIGWHTPPIMQFWLIAGMIAIHQFENTGALKRHKGWLGLGLFYALLIIFNLFGGFG